MMIIEVKDKSVDFRRANMMEICEAVYALASLVPIGRVTSYSSIGKVLGIHPRLVALCLKRNNNPVVIPCHRVVYASGRVGGYSRGGASTKIKLLELEGVHIDRKGRVPREVMIQLESLLYSDARRS